MTNSRPVPLDMRARDAHGDLASRRASFLRSSCTSMRSASKHAFAIWLPPAPPKAVVLTARQAFPNCEYLRLLCSHTSLWTRPS